MPLSVSLWCVAALLSMVPIGAALSGTKVASLIVYGTSLAISLAALAAAVVHLTGGAPMPLTFTLPLGLPWLGAHFRLDGLSAVFLIVVNLGAAAASLYAVGYGRHEHAPERVLAFYPAFLAAMNLVVLADDAFSFLLAWEFMSLSSWALVVAHHRVADNIHAGYVYLLMASVGTLALLLAFGLLAGPQGLYGFDQIRLAAPSPGLEALVLMLVLAGAGSKAGLVPLHVWLPLAHPAAPSHVSALMSGVMTKVAVYGFVRIVFDLLGPPAWWWSMVVLALGGITCLLGVLHALMQHDLKRLLAYHTVENIGIIFIGLGLALAFEAHGMAAAAALAMSAGLFHAFNHCLFKSLLFFGAGAVLTATGERDMEHLGGLIHRMPVTAFFFLVGCVAISALPPFNGFVSEWLTFQAILLSPDLPSWGLRLLVPAVGALLALSAALAAACFVKAFGITFPGPRPRRRRGPRPGDRPLVARRHVFSRRLLPHRRHPSGPVHRCAFAGRAAPHRRGYAGTDGSRVAVDRADHRAAQLLQRAHRLPVHRHRGLPCRLGHPSHRPLRSAPWAGMGLRLSGPEPDHPIHCPELRPADPPGVRRHRLRGPRARLDAAAWRHAPGAPHRRTERSRLGLALRAGRRRRVARHGQAEPRCSSSPSAST